MAIFNNTVINDTGYLALPSGTTAQRPVNPSIGMIRYNTTLSIIEIYIATYGWIQLKGY